MEIIMTLNKQETPPQSFNLTVAFRRKKKSRSNQTKKVIKNERKVVKASSVTRVEMEDGVSEAPATLRR